jgi:aconitase A
MGPEYGATCGFFPVDAETLDYLTTTGRKPDSASRWSRPTPRRKGCSPRSRRRPGLHRHARTRPPRCSPRWPAPSVPKAASISNGVAGRLRRRDGHRIQEGRRTRPPRPVEGKSFDLGHGDVVIAAITSCTNTSNPSVLMAAGLLARNAVAKGLKVKPWVKTSLAPGSQVVAEYLAKSGLQTDLDKLGFNLVGFGCTTCIGNSGPLPAPISKAINEQGLIAGAVISGNRNFEGRVSPDVQANYLASPPLVVAYALAGSVQMDLTTEPLGMGKDGKPVFSRTSGPPTRRSRASSPRTSPARSSRRNMPTSSRATPTGRRSRRPRARPMPGTTIRPMCRTRPISRAWARRRFAGHRDRRRPHPGPVRRQDHHRPHLAGRLDQGGLAGRPYLSEHGVASPTSTSTARAAATMR